MSTLDAETGTWSVTVSLRGEPAEGTTGAVNAVLYPPEAACGSMLDDAAAYLRGNDAPGSTDVSRHGDRRSARAERRVDQGARPDSAVVTLKLTDTAFVGYTPGCVTVTLSNHGVLDRVDAVPFSAPNQPAPPLPPLPEPAPPLPAEPDDRVRQPRPAEGEPRAARWRSRSSRSTAPSRAR